MSNTPQKPLYTVSIDRPKPKPFPWAEIKMWAMLIGGMAMWVQVAG